MLRRRSRRVASGRESQVLVSGEWRVASGDTERRVVVTDAAAASGEWFGDLEPEWRVVTVTGD